MNSLVIIAICGAAFGANDGETYADAHQLTLKTGKPMLVMVSTEWCPACQVMKRRILPQIRERGLLRRVAFATVNPDSDGDLSRQLIGSGPIPELVMFRKTPRGWVRRVMVGSQSVENVEQFINQGIAADEDPAKDDDSAAKAKTPADAKPPANSQHPKA
jgi:thioredoxin-like negative regulator of GroEL